MAINKKSSKIWTFCFTGYIIFTKTFWNSFCLSSYDFITSSQIIAESSILLAKYCSFSQIHLLGFQT